MLGDVLEEELWWLVPRWTLRGPDCLACRVPRTLRRAEEPRAALVASLLAWGALSLGPWLLVSGSGGAGG